MNIEDLLKLNDNSGKMFKESYIKIHYKSFHLKVLKYCSMNNLIDLKFIQKEYHYLHDIPYIKKCYCGNPVKFINFSKGYSNHCSHKCAHNNEKVMNKTKNTLLKKYGVDNLQKSKIIKEKTYKTNLKKYGVKHAAQSIEIQEKMKNTNFKKLGVYYPSQNKNVREKYYKSIMEKNLSKYENITNINYINKKMSFSCDCGKNHIFDISFDLFQNRKRTNIKLCTICNTKYTSMLEKEFYDFLKNIKIQVESNKRNIIPPLELDIYLPEFKLAFEFNGLFWHNELNKENNYHLNKTEECEKQGIQLIHIYEDDWLNKKEIIKSMILNKLNKIENEIHAVKCEIKEINDNIIVRNFLEKNHIQGYIGSQVKIGLFYNDELVSLMIFGDCRVATNKKGTNEYDLLRFCNKLNTNVVDGSLKLFKYFIDNYDPKEITTYADRSYSQGKIYEKLGFKLINKTDPNYYYIIDGIRQQRFNFRKDKLVKKGFDSSKTEHEIMLERKIYRIYDSGNLRFKYK